MLLASLKLYSDFLSKIYVEFGVENCAQCNSRYLRENGWNVKKSLLMDGGHKNEEINLQQVLFW